ncbi:NAD(P)-dependent dehydrogenase (short-subunit alcohol dehydrogenase family) [Paraburkholderia sp. RAU6.4a]
MTQRLAGKTALITAAGQGIGLATAELFAREGARVIATDIRIDGLAGKPVEACKLDVLDGAAIKALAAEVGTIDVLFNCAGFVHSGNILECSEEDWDFAFDLNAKAMYRMIRAFLPAMLEKGRRLDHQHVVGGVEREGCAESLRVRRVEGRGGRADEVRRCGFRHAWCTL